MKLENYLKNINPMKLINTIVFFVLTLTCYAQKTEIITPTKLSDFKTNKKLTWKKVNELFNYKIKDSTFFLYKASDTLDYKKDKAGNIYFKTKIYIGREDKGEIFEIPGSFYQNSDTKYITQLGYKLGNYYLYTTNYEDENKFESFIFTIDKKKNFGTYKIGSTKKEANGVFINLDPTDSELEIDYSDLTTQSHFVFIKNHRKLKNTIPFVYDYGKSTDINSTLDEIYKRTSTEENAIILFDPLEIEREKKVILSSIPIKVNDNNVLALSENEKIITKQNWRCLNEEGCKSSSQLYLFTKKVDSINKTFFEDDYYYNSKIRFGFDDNTYFELPKSYQLHYGTENSTQESTVLAYYKNTFYLYIPSYKNKFEGHIITYDKNKNFTETLISTNPDSRFENYFVKDDELGIVLRSYNKKTNLYNLTYFENNKWVTRAVDWYYTKKKNYRYSNPFYSYQVEPFKKTDFSDFSKDYQILQFKCVFTNNPKDIVRKNQLLKFSLYKPSGNFISHSELDKFYTFNEEIDNLKNSITYKEIPNSLVLVPYMPLPKNQDPFPACHSYAIGGALQQYINSDRTLIDYQKNDANFLKDQTSISYFALQQYFRGNVASIGKESFEFYNYTNSKINKISDKELEFNFSDILQSSLPFATSEPQVIDERNLDNLGESLIKWNEKILEKDNFKDFISLDLVEEQLISSLKDIYTGVNKNPNYTAFSEMLGFPITSFTEAKKAKTFYGFLYKLIVEPSSKNKIYLDNDPFRLHESLVLNEYSDYTAIKQEIAKVLTLGRPLVIGINYVLNATDPKQVAHSMLISGIKKVEDPITKVKYDLFKLENSWGAMHHFKTNDGWYLADDIMSNIFHCAYIDKKLNTNTIDWEITKNLPLFQKAMNTTNSFSIGPIVKTYGTNQKDVSVLTKGIRNISKLDDVVSSYINYFESLGYKLKSEIKDKQSCDLVFDKFEIYLNILQNSFEYNKVYIYSVSKQNILDLASKMDFTKVPGLFKFSEDANEKVENGEKKIYIDYNIKN